MGTIRLTWKHNGYYSGNTNDYVIYVASVNTTGGDPITITSHACDSCDEACTY